MPKYRVPFLHEGASMSSYTTHISRQTCTPDRHGEDPCPDRRPHRRGFCRRPAADSRRGQAQPSSKPPTGARNSPAVRPSSSASAARSSPRAPRPGCGTPASRPRRSKAASRAGRRPSCRWCRASKLPAARRAGPHRLGDAGAAEDRPHRLPLADPPLRRSERGVPVRGAVRGRSRSASASAPRPSTSRTCSGAIAASSAPST